MNLNQYTTGVATPGLSVKNIVPLFINVSSLEEQEAVVSAIGIIERRIEAAEAIIGAASSEKAAVMQRYL